MLSVFMQTGEAAHFLGGSDGGRAVPTYLFPESAALALARAVRHGEWRRRDPGVEAKLDPEARRDSVRGRRGARGQCRRKVGGSTLTWSTRFSRRRVFASPGRRWWHRKTCDRGRRRARRARGPEGDLGVRPAQVRCRWRGPRVQGDDEVKRRTSRSRRQWRMSMASWSRSSSQEGTRCSSG